MYRVEMRSHGCFCERTAFNAEIEIAINAGLGSARPVERLRQTIAQRLRKHQALAEMDAIRFGMR